VFWLIHELHFLSVLLRLLFFSDLQQSLSLCRLLVWAPVWVSALLVVVSPVSFSLLFQPLFPQPENRENRIVSFIICHNIIFEFNKDIYKYIFSTCQCIVYFGFYKIQVQIIHKT
jgi:hypothetical protein